MKKLYCNPSLIVKTFYIDDIVKTSGDFGTFVSFDENWIEQGGGF